MKEIHNRKEKIYSAQHPTKRLVQKGDKCMDKNVSCTAGREGEVLIDLFLLASMH